MFVYLLCSCLFIYSFKLIVFDFLGYRLELQPFYIKAAIKNNVFLFDLKLANLIFEKYSKTCRFVTWCYSLSKVIEPLRSRCLCIHVPTQTSDDIVEWTFNVASIEKINIKKSKYNFTFSFRFRA